MSLSDALRAAALERAEKNGQNVDGIVLEPSGVIDLREMARDASRERDQTVALPAIGTRAQDVLVERPLTETSLWRRLRPVTVADPEAEPELEPVTETATLDEATIDEIVEDGASMIDLTDDTPFEELIPPSVDEPDRLFEAVVIDLDAIVEPPSVFERNVAETAESEPHPDEAVDATTHDVGHPVTVCDRCGSFGQRDLFDRVSGTEYFSCDDCGHMWQQRLDR